MLTGSRNAANLHKSNTTSKYIGLEISPEKPVKRYMSPTKSSSKKVLFNLGSKHKNTMMNLELQLKNIMTEKQHLSKEIKQLRSGKKQPPRNEVSPIRGEPAEIRPHSTTKKSRN